MPKECEYRYVKQTGGKGQFAHVVMRIEPNPGKGYEFVDMIKGGSIPAEFITSVNKGIIATVADGVMAGFPVVDVKVILLDGTFHAVDSSDMAFRICASMCFKKGFMQAAPQLLEPLMKIEINTPDDYIGDVVGNLNRRRGNIASMRRFRKGSQKLNAHAPLQEMFGFATQLRNITSGRASYSMEFLRYEPLSPNIQEQALKKIAEKKKEEQNR
jgi:elongation factor G